MREFRTEGRLAVVANGTTPRRMESTLEYDVKISGGAIFLKRGDWASTKNARSRG